MKVAFQLNLRDEQRGAAQDSEESGALQAAEEDTTVRRTSSDLYASDVLGWPSGGSDESQAVEVPEGRLPAHGDRWVLRNLIWATSH